MSHLGEAIKRALDAHESACLDDAEEYRALQARLEREIYPLLSLSQTVKKTYPKMAEMMRELTFKSVGTWAREVHQLAIEKGWWEKQLHESTKQVDLDAVKNVVAEKLNLIHDEISEASSEARQDDWGVSWMINGFGRVSFSNAQYWVSQAYLGDVDARAYLTSLMVLTEFKPPADILTVPKEELLDGLIAAINKKSKPEGFPIEMVDSIIRSLDLLEALGYDTEKMMRWKYAYNETRSYRHGNKRF